MNSFSTASYSNPFELLLTVVLADRRSTHLGEFSPVLGIFDPNPDLDITLGAMEGHRPVARSEGLGLAVGLAFDADAVLGAFRPGDPIARTPRSTSPRGRRMIRML